MKQQRYGIRIIAVVFLLIAIFAISLLYERGMEMSEAVPSFSYVFPEKTKLDYVIPVSHPNVLVNQNGYEPNDTMLVLFQGSRIPDSFQVIDSNTGRVVYTGEVMEAVGENGKAGEEIRYGDFSQLVQEGEYYIQADYIGQSYPFQIQNDIYKQLFKEAYFATVEDMITSEDVIHQVETAITILQAFEFYPSNFTDDTGIEASGNQIPDILDEMQAVVTTIEAEQKAGIAYPEEEQYRIIGFLAKYAYFYKEYDRASATRCATLAKRMWSDTYSGESTISMSEYFAACELYRFTHNQVFHTVLKGYRAEQIEEYNEDTIFKLFGDLTYLSTVGSIDKVYCNELMLERIDRGITIASDVVEHGRLKLADTVDQMYYRALELMIIDHVLVSHEYRDMVKEQVMYFGGINLSGVNYMEQIKMNPFYLMIMSDIVIDGEIGMTKRIE